MSKRMVGAGLLMGLVAGTGAGLVLQASGLAGAAAVTTSAQVADATATVGGPEHHDGPHGGRGARLDAAATALGMTVEELRTALADGSTIAEVAAAQGVAVQTVIDALLAEVQAHLDAEVAAGEHTAEEAAAKLAAATARITEMVNNPMPERPAGDCEPGRGERRGHGGGGRHDGPRERGAEASADGTDASA